MSSARAGTFTGTSAIVVGGGGIGRVGNPPRNHLLPGMEMHNLIKRLRIRLRYFDMCLHYILRDPWDDLDNVRANELLEFKKKHRL